MKELGKSIHAVKNGQSIKVTNMEAFAVNLVKAGITKGPQSSAPLLNYVRQYEAQLAAEDAAVAAKKQLEPERKFSWDEEMEKLYQEAANSNDEEGEDGQLNTSKAAGQPVISVGTKKKELIGPYKNGGSDYRAQGCPDEVNVHDFVDKDFGKAIPYGVYDIGANAGCVSVGIDHDTAEFAVNAIRRWCETMGRERYPTADRLMITADGGGSNGSRVRLWKVELQKFADETGLTVSVRHYPPGTSKWNKIEHRLFCTSRRTGAGGR